VNGIWHRKRRDPVSPAAWPIYLLLRCTISRNVRLSLGGRLVFMLSGGSVCSVEHVRWFRGSRQTGLPGVWPVRSEPHQRRDYRAEIRIEGEDSAALGRERPGRIA
jgi:hypothetical protein